MKTIKTLLTVAVAGVVFSACNDLDQVPNGSLVTEEQKQQIVADNPSMASASVNALPQMTCSRFAIYGGSPRLDHDFGVPSMFMITDHRGMDEVSDLNDYQWYTAAMTMADFGGTYYDNILYWRTYYNLINSCNSVLSLIEADSDNAEFKYFRAQAYGFRAYAYLNLGQMYQFTYVKNPQAPTVPLILDTNLDECAANGCPRATCEELYTQILSDLDQAIALLDAAEAEGVTRKTEGAGGTAKTFVNQAVLYGLKARVDLIKQDYPAAETAVTEAIRLAKLDGCRVYTRDEVAKPAFKDITDASFLWGYYVDTNSSLTSLIGWGGQMITWHPNGYPGAGCYRKINKVLYSQIPSTDVRKGWWLNENQQPGAGMPSDYREYINPSNADAYGIDPVPAYCNVKFGAYNDAPGETLAAEDIPYMRMEELYLMLAEAQGMQSLATGVATLNSFVQSCRMESYNCTASTQQAFLDEIWFQRRIELWGEGFSYFDMMRFQKDLDRVGAGYDVTLVYQVSANDPVLIYEIIQSEAENNPLIGNVSNGAVKPDAVADK
jgi:hypothetical protein